MAAALDMALDDLVKLNNNKRPTTFSYRGRVSGPIRRFPIHKRSTPYRPRCYHYFSSAPRRSNYKVMEESKWKHDMYYAEADVAEESRVYRNYSREENLVAGMKVLISNLHFGVSDADIKELFSDVGAIKRYSVHRDGSGRPKGTAEIIYGNGQDALQAVKRYQLS